MDRVGVAWIWPDRRASVAGPGLGRLEGFAVRRCGDMTQVSDLSTRAWV